MLIYLSFLRRRNQSLWNQDTEIGKIKEFFVCLDEARGRFRQMWLIPQYVYNVKSTKPT